jgi:hypothetical protein
MVLGGKKVDSPQEFHKSVMPVIAYEKCFYLLSKKKKTYLLSVLPLVHVEANVLTGNRQL